MRIVSKSRCEESKLKMEIRDYIESRGGFWSNVQGGPYSKKGDPDIIACYRGHYVAIEAKDGDNSMDEYQKTRLVQILKAGGIHIEAYSVKDVADVFDSIDSLLFG